MSLGEPLEEIEDGTASFWQGWEMELHKEPVPAPELYGLRVRLIARRYDCDDALIQLSDEAWQKFISRGRKRRKVMHDGLRLPFTHPWIGGRQSDCAMIMPNGPATLPNEQGQSLQLAQTSRIN
ncbi:hypothetical protein [Rhizobium sp. B21/90]|uniref:hypothetical protein n=1 Tax=Rhizobium sp. B21/90 TaxID=2819993 RepID=UPI001C5B1020|nr:hypothetical protein [Rhizobium sp. B21/90]QYA03702.1 hypothetical protein J5278_23170 [Rhizobium sp. B21/90]